MLLMELFFWTKNPRPILNRLSEVEKYNYYFQFTLTAYDRDVELNIPSKNDIIIPAFQQLSKIIGKEKVIWRYDPIFFNDRYTKWSTIVNIAESWQQNWVIIRKNIL